MKQPAKRPFDYMQPELNPERVARMWRAVEEGTQAAPRGRPRLEATLAALAIAAVLLVAYFVAAPAQGPARAVVVQAGERVEAPADGSLLALPDGSSVRLDARAALHVTAASPATIRLALDRGRADCDVTPSAARPFRVDAAGFSVHVKGTRFSVDVAERVGSQPHVSVAVSHGRVEVRGPDGALLAVLGAGQRWSSPRAEGQAEAALDAAPPAAASEAPSPPPTRDAAASRAVRPAERGRELNIERVSGAAALLEQATEARVAGRAAEAAELFARLKDRYPRDPRAGLAAFELARVRLDSLDDARGALAALSFALRHRAASFVAEDAEALRVDALARAGELAACREQRARFLAAHAHSVHRRRVEKACAP